MFLWRREYIRPRQSYADRVQDLRIESLRCVAEGIGIVFKRHECEWLLPHALAGHLKYNPRHLPVVVKQPDNEYYYFIESIRRIRKGWRTDNAEDRGTVVDGGAADAAGNTDSTALLLPQVYP